MTVRSSTELRKSASGARRLSRSPCVRHRSGRLDPADVCQRSPRRRVRAERRAPGVGRAAASTIFNVGLRKLWATAQHRSRPFVARLRPAEQRPIAAFGAWLAAMRSYSAGALSDRFNAGDRPVPVFRRSDQIGRRADVTVAPNPLPPEGAKFSSHRCEISVAHSLRGRASSLPRRVRGRPDLQAPWRA
jgi:hypothetical protein